MTTDPWSAFLTARRRVHQAVVERVELRGWASGDDAWSECGPVGIAEMSAACAAREVLRLLEFASAMAELADCCESNGGSPVVERAFVTRKIREALSSLVNPPKENTDATDG